MTSYTIISYNDDGEILSINNEDAIIDAHLRAEFKVRNAPGVTYAIICCPDVQIRVEIDDDLNDDIRFMGRRFIKSCYIESNEI